MAEVDNHYETILTGRKGEVVRDAIINAAKLINKASNNAFYLGTHPYTDFAIDTDYHKIVEDIDKIYGEAVAKDFEDDNNVREGGPKSTFFVTSGEIYNLLNDYLRPSLKNVLKHEIDPASDMKMKDAINCYLGYLEEARESIMDSIIAKGGKISKERNETLQELADIIRTLSNINRVEVDDNSPTIDKIKMKIDANDKDHHDRKEGDPYYAYGKVDANISIKTTTKTIDVNDETYYAKNEYESSNEPYVGYSSVTVSVPGGKSSNSSSSSRSYGYGGRSTGTDGVLIDNDNMMSSKIITDKSEHLASEDGVVGWKTVSVQVELEPIPDGATFEVIFMDGNEQIGPAVQVKPFERAKCQGELSKTKTGEDGTPLIFSGWFPNPNRVVSNMTVKAGWRPGTIEDSKEITDDWNTIVSNSGSPYNIGDWKRLTLGDSKGTLIMQKVYEGEDDTVSTWLSMNLYNAGKRIGNGWWTSPLRTFLNGEFMEYIRTGDGGSLADYIVPVAKTSIGTIPAFNKSWYEEHEKNVDITGYFGGCEIQTSDKIWIPSVREIFGDHDESKIDKLISSTYNGLNPETSARIYGRPWPSVFGGNWSIGYVGEETNSVVYNDIFGKSSWSIKFPQTPDNPNSGGPQDTQLIPALSDKSKAIKKLGENESSYQLRTPYKIWASRSNSNVDRRTFDPVEIDSTGSYTQGSYNSTSPVCIGFCL